VSGEKERKKRKRKRIQKKRKQKDKKKMQKKQKKKKKMIMVLHDFFLKRRLSLQSHAAFVSFQLLKTSSLFKIPY
jgi:hypothetical protein